MDREIMPRDNDVFKVGQGHRVCHRVRIGFTAPPKRADATRGFAELRRLLDTAPVASDSYE